MPAIISDKKRILTDMLGNTIFLHKQSPPMSLPNKSAEQFDSKSINQKAGLNTFQIPAETCALLTKRTLTNRLASFTIHLGHLGTTVAIETQQTTNNIAFRWKKNNICENAGKGFCQKSMDKFIL